MAIIERWPAAPRSIALGRRDVHVWSVDLDPPTAGAEALAATLSSDERDRAARFHFDRDRRRFVHARGALRSVLAAYVNATPSELSFAYGAHGKPALGGNYAGRLSFNVSH